MSNQEFEKPWHATPTKLIMLALELAESKTDTEQQVAFLLLDVGVETALKTYLTIKGHSLEKISFPELINKVDAEIRKENLELPLDKIKYLHGIRNKLYHEGDGVKPTEANLQTYTQIARLLITTLFKVDINQIKKKNEPISIPSEYLYYITNNIASITSNSALIIEKIKPQITSRKTEAQFKTIKEELQDNLGNPLNNFELARQRIDEFNKITGLDFSVDEYDLDLVDFFLAHPDQLAVWFVFEQIYKDDSPNEWDVYMGYYKNMHFKQQSLDDKQVYEWTLEKAKRIYEIVQKVFPKLKTNSYSEILFF